MLRAEPTVAGRHADDVKQVAEASDDSRYRRKVVEFGTRTAIRGQKDWLPVWHKKSEKS